MVQAICFRCNESIKYQDMCLIYQLNNMDIGKSHENFCRQCNIDWILILINNWDSYQFNGENNINNYVNALRILQ
jgi:hypothetical protein